MNFREFAISDAISSAVSEPTCRNGFTPLAKHTELALRDFTADDLDIAHHVLAALIEAMRVFRTELRE